MSDVAGTLLSDGEQGGLEVGEFLLGDGSGEEVDEETGVGAVEAISMINDIHYL